MKATYLFHLIRRGVDLGWVEMDHIPETGETINTNAGPFVIRNVRLVTDGFREGMSLDVTEGTCPKS